MTRFDIIVNPLAANGRAGAMINGIERTLQSWGLDFTMLTTSRPGDATVLARQSTADVVVSVGGDGTVNEVVNGLPAGTTLAIIPAGSGNDLIKSLPIPKKPAEALKLLKEGKPRLIDLGTVSCGTSEKPAESVPERDRRLFVNGVGIGFDAAVAARKGEIPYLSGLPVYVLAVFQTLGRFKAPLFAVHADGVARNSRHLLVAIGNGKCAGGGFFLTPDADPGDGQLDVCLIDDVSIPTILKLMPKVMMGKHRGHPSVSFVRTTEIRLQSETPFFVHADGEIVGRDVTSVAVTTLPHRLSVLTY